MAFLGKLIKQKCDNAEYLALTQCPVLIIHGMKVLSSHQDELIHYSDIVAMYNYLQSKKISLVVTQELEHNVYSEFDDLYQPILEYYEKVFPLNKVVDSSAINGRSSVRFSRISRASCLM